MLDSISGIVASVTDWVVSVAQWDFWGHFRTEFVRSSPPLSGSIFGFAEYLASLALLLVVFTVSDFRYRYRFSMARINLRTLGVWTAFGIGASTLIVDLWYENHFLVPAVLVNSNNIKIVLGLVFLIFIFFVLKIIIISPPRFGKGNANHFFATNYHFIHEGNPDRLHVIAEELRGSLMAIAKTASRAQRKIGHEQANPPVPDDVACANDFILLLGDRRFCKIVVERIPGFALNLFEEVKKYPDSNIPVYQFSRNIGQEFIRNTNSAYYQEDSGYQSGLFGYTRPITRIIFGSYIFIERCASDGASPLDTDFTDFSKYDRIQMDGFSRACLAFFEDYLIHTKGRDFFHSYALFRLFHSFEYSLSGLHQVDGHENISDNLAYQRLSVTIDFIRAAIKLVEERAERPDKLRRRDERGGDIFDRIANLIFETIFAASKVNSPPWTAWQVQHNTVWSSLFSFDDSKANTIVAFKVRRLMYEEIRRMDKFPNFKSARILGYCLLIFGLTLMDRRKGYRREFYPLQAAALKWTRENYGRLLEENPKVAESCLMGSVTYDADGRRLVKTYSGETRKEPNREYLVLS